MAAVTENPSSVRVRKLDPWVIKTHARIAEDAGRSLEEYLRVMLTEQALQAQHDFADQMEQRRAEIEKEFGTDFPSGESLIQAVREEE